MNQQRWLSDYTDDTRQSYWCSERTLRTCRPYQTNRPIRNTEL